MRRTSVASTIPVNGTIASRAKRKVWGFHTCDQDTRVLFQPDGAHRCGGTVQKLTIGTCLGPYYECAKCGQWRSGEAFHR